MPELNNSSVSVTSTSTDNIEPVEWLTKEYLENALRIYKNDQNLKIINFKITPATSKGENYASILTRIKIEFICDDDNNEIQIENYIIKTSFEGDEIATEKMLQYDVYNREMEIYEIFIPKMNKILQELHNNKNNNENDQLFAETIYVDYKHTAILFEDLSIKSYKLVDRLKGLDMLHTKIALRKLAKMHAISAVLNERELNIFKKYDRGMFNRYTEAFSAFYMNNLEICGKYVSEWDDFKIYGEKLLKLIPYVMEYGKRVFDVNDNHFNTLIHGDFWTNNIMFTYDNNDNLKPKDARIIDFQFSCWASPTIDLHYFFNTSMTEELRLHNQEELLQYYYEILSNSLKILNYKGKIPSLHEFWIQYMEKSFYAFISACLVQPVMLNTVTTDADFHAIHGDNERSRNFKKILYQNEVVQKNLKRLLPMFDRKGLIDIQNY